MKWRYPLFVFLFISIFLCACTVTGDLEESCDAFQQVRHRINETEVKVGDEFTMTLCSNPTTGHVWSNAIISQAGIVEQVGHRYLEPDGGDQPPAVGAAGKEVWRFKAFATGETLVSWEYFQPWDGGEKKAWTFVLEVTVK
jgi:predicted secreted protein